MISTLLLPALLTLAAAQSTTILNVPGPDSDSDELIVSVVGADSAATTLAFGCASGNSDCGPGVQTLVYGPSTWNLDYSDVRSDNDFTVTMDCAYAASSAVCKEMAAGSEANFPGSSTETYSDLGTWTITVTAGAEKLTQSGQASAQASASSSTAAASESAAASAGSTVQTASVTPAPGSGSAAASASVSKTGSVAAPASTGAAAVNAMVFGGGFVGVAAGVFGGLLL